MLRTHSTSEITAAHDGKTVTIGGFIRSKREHGNIIFLVVADRDGEVQVTAKKGDVPDSVMKTVASLGKESVVTVAGTVKKNSQAPRGVELIPRSINILSVSEPVLPLDFKVKASIDKRLDWRSIDLRKKEVMAIFKVQSALIHGMINYLQKERYLQVFTPCLIGSTSEGGADVFPVIYFQKEAFLRQDPQLHRELAIVGGLDKIYDIGPSWRAEPSHTTRHLCEHRGCAVEASFISDEQEVMRIEENLVVAALESAKKLCAADFELLNIKLSIPKTPFPVLEFPGVYDILENMGKTIPHGEDYDRESEVLLWEYVKKKFKSDFFFVNRFPSGVKSFYVMRYDDDPQWARSTDLMYKGLEMSSGGQREHRYDVLMKQITEKKLNPASFAWFTEFFRFGVPPMGGFNIGIERLTQKTLDLDNVREAALFPRDTERLLP